MVMIVSIAVACITGLVVVSFIKFKKAPDKKAASPASGTSKSSSASAPTPSSTYTKKKKPEDFKAGESTIKKNAPAAAAPISSKASSAATSATPTSVSKNSTGANIDLKVSSQTSEKVSTARTVSASATSAETSTPTSATTASPSATKAEPKVREIVTSVGPEAATVRIFEGEKNINLNKTNKLLKRPKLPDPECSIQASSLKPGDVFEEELYTKQNGEIKVLKQKKQPWSEADRNTLSSMGQNLVFVKPQSDLTFDFLASKLNDIISDGKVPVALKSKAFYSVGIQVMRGVFDQPDLDESFQQAEKIVQHSIDYLSRDRSHFVELLRSAATNFSEYSHCIHVAAYAISFAKQIGFRDQAQLRTLAIGALFHDIGKSKVPTDILEKEGIFNTNERAEIKKHSSAGFDILSKYPKKVVPELSRLIVLQHHERPNGKGYPLGISNDIHVFSKIVSIADTYDALISERTYKEKLTPVEAAEFMIGEMAGDFDKALLTNFFRTLPAV